MQPNFLKIQINFFIISLFCSFSLLSKPTTESTLKLQGVVEDISGNTLKGATITIERNGQTINTSAFNESGAFSITIEKFYPGVSETYLWVRKEGYKSYRHKVFSQCGDEPLNIQMQSKVVTPRLHQPLTQSSFFTI